MAQVAARRFGHGRKIAEDLSRARLEISTNNIHRIRVERYLPGQENELATPDRLRISTDGRYDVQEVFSNADGSVQFVELLTTSNNQQSLDGHTLVASQDASSNTYNFVGSGPSPTANTHLLLATADFEDACEGLVPDYILADGFLFDPDGTVNFGEGADVITYSTLPLDGETSLNYPGETEATSTPRWWPTATVCSA